MTNYIWVTNQKELYHAYPNAPEEVSFLRNKHRHIFHFKTYIEVMHDDREIEFIMFKNFIQLGFLEQIDIELNNKSCEMLSDLLYAYVNSAYPNRKIIIEVSEDKENGSYKEYF